VIPAQASSQADNRTNANSSWKAFRGHGSVRQPIGLPLNRRSQLTRTADAAYAFLPESEFVFCA